MYTCRVLSARLPRSYARLRALSASRSVVGMNFPRMNSEKELLLHRPAKKFKSESKAVYMYGAQLG